MATIAIENGKRIEELIQISQIHRDAFFLVSDQSLTRKINLVDLRNAFCGDIATSDKNNLFYSIEKTDQLFNNVYEEISKTNSRVDNLDQRVNNIYNDIGGDLSEFQEHVQEMYEELTLADQNLQTQIDNLSNDFDDFKTNTNNEINSLKQRMTAVENKLKGITAIQVGTAVPSNLAAGTIYIQYF